MSHKSRTSVVWHTPANCAGPDSDPGCDNSGPNCVQVARHGAVVQVRDSKRGEQSRVLSFTTAEWDAFVEAVDAGASAGLGALTAERGAVKLRDLKDGASGRGLMFSQAEWDAFVDDVRAGGKTRLGAPAAGVSV